jgi:hypothetical protein
MTIPPPPGGDPGGFYGGRVPPPPPPTTLSASTFGFPPGPVGGPFGAPAATFAPAGQSTSRGVPEAVTVACSMLGVFAAIGVYTLIAVLTLSGGTDSGSSDGTTSITGVSLGVLYGVLWGGSGLINAAAIFYLRQGNALARLVTSVICGLWAAYWLRYLVKLAHVSGSTVFVAGSLVHLGELLLLGLAVASALPAALLWRPSAKAHFG